MSFILFNQAGKVAISSEYPSMRFLSKLVVSRTTEFYETTITSTVGAPVIFIKPVGAEFTSCYLFSLSGNEYTFRIYASGGENAPVSLTLYIFVPDAIPASGYGINMYRADGSISFSTATRLLKISGHYIAQAEKTGGLSDAASYSLASGSLPTQYAICSQTHGYSYLPLVDLNSTVVLLLGARVDVNTQLLKRGGVQAISGFGGVRSGTDLLGPVYVPIIDTSLYD